MAKILVVEDDDNLLDMICEYLRKEQHVVDSTDNGPDALNFLKSYEYDIIVLDLIIPGGLDGIEVLEEHRKRGGTTRTLILTGRDTIDEKEIGFDAGADDYLTKPFDMRELGSRVRALLRRSVDRPQNDLAVGGIKIDFKNHRVTADGKSIELAPKEFALLEFFMTHPNEVFSTEAIMDRVWQADADAAPHTVKTCVYRLRNKLGLTDELPTIKNIHGVGYKLETAEG